MRKLICLMTVVCFSLLANAQFVATKDGIKANDDLNFYVVEIEGKTAKELYENVESYIIANFKNPDVVLNKQEGKMINIHGVFPEAFPCKKWAGVKYADIDLNLVVYFKDAKIRFDAPVINSMVCRSLVSTSGKPYTYFFYKKFNGASVTGDFSLFKKNGDVKNELAVNGLNEFLNNLIKEIADYAKGEFGSEEW